MDLLVALLLGPGLVLLACDTRTEGLHRCEGGCEDCDPSCSDCPASGCAAAGVQGWSGPVLLWTGPHDDAPPCPEDAPAVVYEGHDGLTARQSCPTCDCGEPACLFPEGVYLADEQVCPPFDDPDALLFPAPERWDGACVSPGNFPPEQAVTLKFLPTRVRGCAPIAGPEPEATSIAWATLARACGAGARVGAAGAPGAAGAADALPPGFSRCVYRDGTSEACPARYPERRVFHARAGSDLACTPCTCGSPEGSDCVAYLEVHDSPTCSTYVSSAMSVDHRIEEGELSCIMALGSPTMGPEGLRATMTTDSPGECASAGGEPAGEAWPEDPSTFCCEPPP